MYYYTNENLQAIVAGLDLSSKDTILAVGGSGDQAFALLEFAGEVKVVDNQPNQIGFIKQRVEALLAGDDEAFFRNESKTATLIGPRNHQNSFLYDQLERDHNHLAARRRRYFTEESGRLERIQERLTNLIIAEPGDLVKVAQQERGDSKIYLSNILGYYDGLADEEDYLRNSLNKVARNLPFGGIIYVTNHNELVNSVWRAEIIVQDLAVASFLPPKLEIDPVLSLKARAHEKDCWHPAVYRRV